MARLIPPQGIQEKLEQDPFAIMMGGPMAVRNVFLPAGMTAREAKRIIDAYKAVGKIPMEDVFKFFRSGAKGGGAVRKGTAKATTAGAKFLTREEDVINTLLGFPGG